MTSHQAGDGVTISPSSAGFKVREFLRDGTLFLFASTRRSATPVKTKQTKTEREKKKKRKDTFKKKTRSKVALFRPVRIGSNHECCAIERMFFCSHRGNRSTVSRYTVLPGTYIGRSMSTLLLFLRRLHCDYCPQNRVIETHKARSEKTYQVPISERRREICTQLSCMYTGQLLHVPWRSWKIQKFSLSALHLDNSGLEHGQSGARISGLLFCMAVLYNTRLTLYHREPLLLPKESSVYVLRHHDFGVDYTRERGITPLSSALLDVYFLASSHLLRSQCSQCSQPSSVSVVPVEWTAVLSWLHSSTLAKNQKTPARRSYPHVLIPKVRISSL
ncbi:uncharacterized protein BO95DRAFT_245436 [Aspergillus brunneoviolaceus CBS 621.78]|uniref:Uncharacterized protein n=1 Tax=Aspergillus brunneoviolaceus CBS 621.78 TaxID=1450534 RepID=A0ACD1GKP0_9EURO|nr:hypothetical protein BO95DRAFT_245436 [Aspergillus brunneoviolaceus CBS 621.78]RAH49805.1 hypothetical protein BO95DRAFT_245436 [Aspergillus brunneoviolaceus CBS 621.78]